MHLFNCYVWYQLPINKTDIISLEECCLSFEIDACRNYTIYCSVNVNANRTLNVQLNEGNLFQSTAYAYFLSFLCHYHLNNVRQCEDTHRGLQLVIEKCYSISNWKCFPGTNIFFESCFTIIQRQGICTTSILTVCLIIHGLIAQFCRKIFCLLVEYDMCVFSWTCRNDDVCGFWNLRYKMKYFIISNINDIYNLKEIKKNIKNMAIIYNITNCAFTA